MIWIYPVPSLIHVPLICILILFSQCLGLPIYTKTNLFQEIWALPASVSYSQSVLGYSFQLHVYSLSVGIEFLNTLSSRVTSSGGAPNDSLLKIIYVFVD